MPKLTAQQIASAAKAAGFPPDQIATATAVALAESGGNTTATNRNKNGSTDYGLWQINSVHGALLNQGDKFDPAANAKMALTVYQRAGNRWTPWTVYNSQTYRGQLPAATMAAAQVAQAVGPTTGAGPTGPTAGPEAVPGETPPAAAPPAGIMDLIPGIITQVISSLISAFSGYALRIGAGFLGVMLLVFGGLGLAGVTPTKVITTAASKAPGV